MMNKWLKPVCITLILVGVVLGLRQLPINQWVDRLEETLNNMGAIAPLIYFFAYSVACVALLPGSALTLLAGALWGVVYGTIAVSISSVFGATLAFLVGRYLARERVEKQIEKFPKFKAVADSLSEGGFKLVALIRLSPAFPFNLLNYMMGITRVKLKDYVLGSWVGMFPATIMYVYLGAAGKEIAKAQGGGGKSSAEWALLVVGLMATIAVTILVTRKARATLQTINQAAT